MISRFMVVSALTISLAWAICFGSQAAFAQGQPEVSVVNLNVQPGKDGGQLVLTPRGVLYPLPGGGVDGNVVSLYMGKNGGYWYTDRTGKTIDLTSYVQQIRSQPGQAPAAVPQYEPYPTQTTTTQSSGNAGTSALAAGVGAGVGAMVGTGVANAMHYNNVPYGTPMYYNNNRPYYNDDRGKEVFVNEDGEVKWNNVYAGKQIKQNNQAEKAAAVQSQRASTQSQSAPPQGAHQYQQQQNWYHEQSQDKSRAQSWQKQSEGDNPFVRQSREGERTARGERSGGGERAARAERAGGGERGGGGRAGGGGGRSRWRWRPEGQIKLGLRPGCASKVLTIHIDCLSKRSGIGISEFLLRRRNGKEENHTNQ